MTLTHWQSDKNRNATIFKEDKCKGPYNLQGILLA